MKIVLATNNPHKVGELTDLLSGEGREIRTLRESASPATSSRTARRSRKIRISRPAPFPSGLGCIAVADDSGWRWTASAARPRVFGALRGEHATDGENIDKLLAAVRGKSDRRARFVSVITAVFPDGRRITARGECEGLILDERRGSGCFGYDPVFYYEPLGKTFAEMTAEEKNAVSHRGIAVRRFAEMFFLDKPASEC